MKNILLISQDTKFLDSVVINVSSKLNMFYLNIEKLFSYNLGKAEDVISKCGINYLVNQERKIIQSLNFYENTIAIVDSCYAIKYDMFELLKENYDIYFVKLSKKVLNFLNNNYKIDEKNDINIILDSDVKKYMLKNNINQIMIKSAAGAEMDLLKGINNEN